MRSYLRAANVTWDGLSLHDVKMMNFSPSEFETYRLHSGDVLLAEASGSASEVGKPAIWRDEIPDCCFQNTLIRVRSLGPLPAFLLYLFKYEALHGGFADASRGVGIHHLGAKSMSDWPVPLPPLAEQGRIVAAIEEQLSRLDAGIESLGRAQRSLRLMRASLLQAAVEGRLVPLEHDLAREEGRPFVSAQDLLASAGASISMDIGAGDDDLPVLPDGWMWVRLATLLSEPLRNGHSAKATLDDDGVRTLTLTAVTKSDFSEINTKMTSADRNKVKALWLRPGDILIERSNTAELVGTAAMYRGPDDYAIFPDLLIRARIMPRVSPEFIELALRSHRTRRYFQRSAQGIAGNMPKIDQTVVERLPLPIPPPDEQSRIVEEARRQFSLLDALASALNVSAKRADALRRSILSSAFQGRLVTQDVNDEPASIPSERLAASSRNAVRLKE